MSSGCCKFFCLHLGHCIAAPRLLLIFSGVNCSGTIEVGRGAERSKTKQYHCLHFPSDGGSLLLVEVVGEQLGVRTEKQSSAISIGKRCRDHKKIEAGLGHSI